MNLTDPDKRELLDELFAEGEPSSCCSDAEDMLMLIQSEKRARSQRYRLVGTASFLGLLALAFAFFAVREPASNPLADAALGRTPAASLRAAPSAAEQLPIERLDDEALLKLLDTTPSALVQWPDGRRSLMVLVKAAPAGS